MRLLAVATLVLLSACTYTVEKDAVNCYEGGCQVYMPGSKVVHKAQHHGGAYHGQKHDGKHKRPCCAKGMCDVKHGKHHGYRK